MNLLGERHPAEEEEEEEDGVQVEEVRLAHALLVRGFLLLAFRGRRQVRHAQVELDARVNA